MCRPVDFGPTGTKIHNYEFAAVSCKYVVLHYGTALQAVPYIFCAVQVHDRSSSRNRTAASALTGIHSREKGRQICPRKFRGSSR